jgi:hypothetical protein
MIMPDKSRRTAAELKLLIEEKLLAGHPDCERVEVVINPPAAGRPVSNARTRIVYAALGHEQTSRHDRVMSVIRLKAAIHQRGFARLLRPIADMSAIQKSSLAGAGSRLDYSSNKARSIPETSSLILFMAECVTLTSSSTLFS